MKKSFNCCSAEDLDRRFKALPKEYKGVKAACDSQVVEWKWASASRHDPRPFYYERHRWKPGRILTQEPPSQNGKYQYGYDAQGRVVIERQHVRFDGYPERLWYYETFNVWQDGHVGTAHYSYSPDKKPIYFAHRPYDGDGRIVLWESRATYGLTRELYRWKEGKAVEVEIFHADLRTGPVREPSPRKRLEARYTDLGQLEEVAVILPPDPPRRPDPRKEIVFSRSPVKLTLKKLSELTSDLLFDQICRVVQAASIQEPVYCLAMAWSPGQFSSLPPNIGLGLQSERDGWLEKHGVEAKWYIWNPAEFVNYGSEALALDTPELNRACELLNQELGRSGNWSAGTKMLNDVARRLMRHNWSDAFEPTDDFTAYATEYELSDCTKNMKAVASKEQFATFKTNGWLI